MREKNLTSMRERILAKWRAKSNIRLLTVRPGKPFTTPIKQSDRK